MHPETLAAWLRPYLLDSPLARGRSEPWPESRWQPLPSLGEATWIKRDDELSFSISGSKWRKLLSLAAGWQREGVDRLVTWGSSRSQFILGLLQIAAELRIKTEVFLLRATPWQAEGPDQLFALWTQDAEVFWVERQAWAGVAAEAAARLEALQAAGRRTVLIPEGGAEAGALPGALTLALEVVQQEAQLGLQLERIWVDAGSGFTAQALLCGLGWLRPELQVHIVLCAGTELEFAAGLAQRQQECEMLFGQQPPRLPPWQLHRPPTARSFGAINARVWGEIEQRARCEGLLLDPLYTAKLLLTYQQHAKTPASVDLLIHSGGGLSVLAHAPPWGRSQDSGHRRK